MSIWVRNWTGVPDESTRIFRTLPLRTSHAVRLCWIAIVRARKRYAVTSRLAERRELATHVPRTDLTVIESMIPMITNTSSISMNVNPAIRDRRDIDELSTNPPETAVETGADGREHGQGAYRCQPASERGPFTFFTASISTTSGKVQQGLMV